MARPLFLYFLLLVFIPLSFYSCKSNIQVWPNIILVVPDALRARQLPCYGYDKIATPNIDCLAEEGTILKHALVRTPVTQPSFSNLFSGLLLPMNCLRWGEKSLAQYLKESGYQTVGIVGSRVLSTWAPEWKGRGRKYFDRGFDEYIQDEALFQKPYTRKNEEVTVDVLAWLENWRKRETANPFFLICPLYRSSRALRPRLRRRGRKNRQRTGQNSEKVERTWIL